MATIAWLIGVTILLFPHAVVTQGPVVDWEKQKAESLRHYRSLIQLDSSNPPGNETLVVDYLKRGVEVGRHTSEDLRGGFGPREPGCADPKQWKQTAYPTDGSH